MQNPKQDTTNANGGSWNDELDAYAQLLSKSADVDFATNFGHGNYREREFYQQVQNHAQTAKVAPLQEQVFKVAIHETIVDLGTDGITYYDEDENTIIEETGLDDDADRDEIVEEGRRIWEKLNRTNRAISEKQVEVLVKKSGHDPTWQPFWNRQLAFFHEASRSLDGELLRDFLTGVKELRGNTDSETADQLLGGRSR